MLDRSYLVTANSNNEHYDADCNFCLADFTPELLKQLAKWRAAFLANKKKFPDVDEWRIGNTHATFISRKAAEALLGEEKFEEMDSESGGDPFPVLNRDGIDLEKFDATVADEIRLVSDGFWWEASPRHSEIIVGSEFFRWKWFTQCAHCGHHRSDHAKGKCLFDATTYKANALMPDSNVQGRGHRAAKRRVSKLRAKGKGAR